jgi:branched-chain amino acid transport system substrate-binding protein
VIQKYNTGRKSMRRSGGALLAVTLVAVAAVGGSASAADKTKIGFFSTLEGPYTALGEDGQRGFDLALMQHKNKAGGKDLEIVRGCSDASPDSALRAAKKLVEQDRVDILLAPLSGSEDIALRDYAKTQPQVTIINGCSGALETTYVTPAPNFFRFNIDGAQMHKGLGNTSITSRAIRKSRPWAKTIRSSTRRYSDSHSITARWVARSPSVFGFRLEPRTSAR